jgi:hypothetical protein
VREGVGEQAEIERLKGELKRLMAENPGPSGAVVVGGASGVALSDPLERLQKLADLRDHGVLRDTEFATEEAKILGNGSDDGPGKEVRAGVT